MIDLENIPQEAKESQIKIDAAKWPLEGKVEFVNASVKYRPPTEKVINDLSFVVQPGAKIGIIGRTGAGKSTIGLCISRIIELCGGRIEIDGIDISKIDLQTLRDKVTVIS